MRLEGADYVVQDGDVMRFRFNLLARSGFGGSRGGQLRKETRWTVRLARRDEEAAVRNSRSDLPLGEIIAVASPRSMLRSSDTIPGGQSRGRDRCGMHRRKIVGVLNTMRWRPTGSRRRVSVVVTC